MCLSMTMSGPGQHLDTAVERLHETGHDVQSQSPYTLIAYGDSPEVAAEAVRDLDWSISYYVDVGMQPRGMPEAA